MSDSRVHDTIRLSAEGIAKVLGDLEARVMQAAWVLATPASARTVHARVVTEHAVALHTVITVLNRLVVKGLLRREKRDGVLHYQACLTEDAFREQTARRMVQGILSFGPAALAASFVDALAQLDPEALREMDRRIQRRLAGRGGG